MTQALPPEMMAKATELAKAEYPHPYPGLKPPYSETIGSERVRARESFIAGFAACVRYLKEEAKGGAE